MDEREAVARLKSSDISGLEHLVTKYQVQAVRAAYLVCRDYALAEDIVQSAFIRAYERIEQFDSNRSFGPWFLRSVTNDALKAAARREKVVPLGDSEYESLSLDPGLEERLEKMETTTAISCAIAQLPPEQRAAIVMRYYLELSDEEMSAQLDCATSTVRWRLHSARRKLRQLLPPWLKPSVEEPSMGEAGAIQVAAYVNRGDAL